MKRLSIALCAFSVLLFAPPLELLSQEIASLRAGEPIRLTVDSPSVQRIEGSFVSLSPAILVLRERASVRPVGFSTIRSLEVRRRSGRAFMKSVGIGLLAGGVGGGIIGLATGTNGIEDFNTQAMALLLGVYGGIAGMGVAAAYGACAYSWNPVPLP